MAVLVLMLCFVFLLSGAAGLLFETLWFRVAGLSLGNSVWASSVVLAAFMCGLAIGNAFAARYGYRVRRPVELYAVLELLVGAAGLGALAALPAMSPALQPVFAAVRDTPWLANSIRLAVAFVLMVVPASAMGLTLPLLTKALSRAGGDFGCALGRLYGYNTLGGVAGALIGELWLIERLGLRGTGYVAASLNLAAGLLALSLARATAKDEAAPAPSPALLPHRRLAGGGRFLLAGFISGAVVLALEVVWFRFLQLFISGTALAFATMLAVVLLGIGLGGLVASAWFRRQPSAAGWLPVLSALAGVATVVTYSSLPTDVYGSDLGVIALLSARLMFPTTFVSGMVFVFVGRALWVAFGEETRATGLLTLANTAGATVGAVAGGFVLLPALGVDGALFTLVLLYGAIALLTWERRAGGLVTPVLAGAAALFVLSAVLFPFGLMRNHYLRATLERFDCTGAEVVRIREGRSETSSLLRFDWGEQQVVAHRLITNGHSMSGTHFFARRYMKLYVYWALAVNPSVKNALLICYGVGNTASALRDSKQLQTIDVVDLSRDVLDMSSLIYPPAENPLLDPRVKTHIEDGRFFLQTTDRRFDLITAEPPPPKIAGVVNLYSREFFQLVRDRLTEGGVVTYWLPIHQFLPRESRAVTAAFCGVFPNCSMWTGMADEWMLAAVRGEPARASAQEFERQWLESYAREGLIDVGLEVPAQLGATFIADSSTLRQWVGDAPPLEDNFPARLSPRLPASEELTEVRALMHPERTRRAFASSDFVRSVWPPSALEETQRHFAWQRAYNDGFGLDEDRLFAALHDVLTRSTLRTLPTYMMNSAPRFQAIAAGDAAQGVQAPGLSLHLGIGAMVDRDYLKAAGLFAEARAGDASLTSAGRYQVLALELAGHRDEALEVLSALPMEEVGSREARAKAWLEQLLQSDSASTSTG